MVRTVVMPREILSEVASLLSQKGTQEMTTISMQGPYTCTRAKCSQAGLSLVESFGVLKYFQSDLNDEVPHVSLEMESDHQRGVISWDKTTPDCTAREMLVSGRNIRSRDIESIEMTIFVCCCLLCFFLSG